ncbi:MAG: MT-A70 family methyltransferase [Bacteroidia bacterium]|nr:MT-A70 family methyltransferase [Bacteroidia bacterium]
MKQELSAQEDFRVFTQGKKFATILADPPWQFQNRTGKMAPEHKRLSRYPTLNLDEIKAIPVSEATADTAHLYLWVPNALLAEGLEVMQAWGFTYKTNLIWYKTRKDGGPDRRGVGFYFRNVTEIILFGVRGKNPRTLQPGRTQENIIVKQKREHSRKPDEQYELIEACSRGPFLEMFARGNRPKWVCWGNQADDYFPDWETYKNHSQKDKDEELILLHDNYKSHNGDQMKLFEGKTDYTKNKQD